MNCANQGNKSGYSIWGLQGCWFSITSGVIAYPSSSAWDWETDGTIVPDHVNRLDHCKLPLSSWACEVECCDINHDRSTSPSHSPSDGRCDVAVSKNSRADLSRNGDFLNNQVVTPAMANMHSSLLFHDASSPSNIGPLLQARVPTVTTCIGASVHLGANDHANGSLESVVQKKFVEIHGNVVNGNPKNNENGRWFDKITETELEHSHLSKGKKISEVDFSDHLSAPKDKIVGSIYNGIKDMVKEKQQSSVAKGSFLSGDSPTGLQLGKRTYPLDAMSPLAAKAAVKSNAVAKKPRGFLAASQVP